MNSACRVGLSVMVVGLLAGLAPALRGDDKASATGTWKATFTGQNGQSIETVYTLKQDGDKLTGTVKRGETEPVKIEEGKIKDGQFTFNVTRERNGNKIVAKYSGKVEGDGFKAKITVNFGGEDRTFDIEAKREK
jgi:hypothetical protein